MTQNQDSVSEGDRGYPFFVVRMVVPSSFTLERLPVEIRIRVETNLERARRVFRAWTLPIPGTEYRLFPASLERFSIGYQLNNVVLEGVEDPAIKAILALPASNCDDYDGSRVVLVQAVTVDGEDEIRHTADLLGKYWYRYREKDFFDYIELVDKLKTASQQGELGPSFWKNWDEQKQPAPKRRRSE
jgi:hypothetical protein